MPWVIEVFQGRSRMHRDAVRFWQPEADCLEVHRPDFTHGKQFLAAMPSSVLILLMKAGSLALPEEIESS
jgi:hypothetical protein